jgi:hypothetical protein
MGFWMLIGGLVLAIGGAAVAGFADTWLSRSVLIYLDAVEENVGEIVKAVQAGTKEFAFTGINLQRDRGQNRARTLKTMGWLTLTVGFGLQFVSACLGR